MWRRLPFPGAQRRSFALPGSPGAIAALDFGPGEAPVEALFLHANGFCASSYRAMLEALGHRHRVLAIDQRGHGRSTLPAEPQGRLDWLDLRDDLLALLGELALGPVALSGHSMGATIAVLAAAARPDLVKSLVLFDPVLLPPEVSAQARRRGPDEPWPSFPLVQGALRRRATFESRAAAAAGLTGRGAFKSWPASAVADYGVDGLLDQPDGGVRLACAPTWEAANYCAQGHDGWAALSGLQCPVRLLLAELGSTCDEERARTLASKSARLSVKVVPGASHFIPQERPELAAEALAMALEEPLGP